MPQSLLDQEYDIHNSATYDDTISPTEAAFETNPLTLEDDLNNLRSQVSNLLDVQAGDWWDDVNTPSAFENGAQRGVNDLNTDLHALERKRVLRRRPVAGVDISGGSSVQHVILGSGELPGNTTAAVGAVTTLGTVVAQATSFDTASASDVVSGGYALQPKNLVKITDGTTGDPILDSNSKEIYGLLQSESGTDGHTITTSTPYRVQISFVVRNSTNDGLVLITAGDMDGHNFDYAPAERYALDDLPEHAFLGDDYIDAGAANTDRQAAYDNQGTTPVDLTTNATLDLEGAGLVWSVRDDAEAALLSITEGSAGGTTEIDIGSDVDTFDVNAVAVTFDGGITVDDGSGGTDIEIGMTAGTINTTGSDNLEIEAAGELFFDDGNRSGSTFSTAVKFSETSTEYDNYETEFGEVSILNALVQATQSVNRSKGIAVVNQNISANTLITGAGGSPNIDAQLPSYNGLTFVSDVEIFINGRLRRPGADASANHVVYPSAVAAERAQGAFYCEYPLFVRGGSRPPDQITMIVFGEPTAP